MKKKVFYGTLFWSLLISLLIVMCCSKEDLATKQQTLLGTWISSDKSDTLTFTSSSDFYKSNAHMSSDHYEYSASTDNTIEVVYRGKMYIYITPTLHTYTLFNNKLTIDFSNKSCYGFELKKMVYEKL